MKRANVAGGVIAVVKKGRLIFARGYGFADLKTHAPVIADQTLFRVGSVSKLFTWTAVMQLVQAGKLNLDTDVNRYLDFKIPPKFGRPVTLRDLMTMTPGFAASVKDLVMPTPKQLFPLRRYLIENMPPRIFPPGKILAYSNYGAALAGYIVQRVSGEPFDEYVESHIFEPLGMRHSTFDQPLPASLRPDMATGYITASSGQVVPFEAVEAAPAFAMSSTATDIARFMIAQLQNGRYQRASILAPATVALMHSQQYNAAPDINGYCLGFYQENRNGLRIIGHGGDTTAFHSDLYLLLDKDVGLFMAFNSLGKNGAIEKMRRALFRSFLDRYFPYTPPTKKTVADPKRDAARVTGWYLGTRRENRAPLALAFLFTQTHVTALPNGIIEISAPLSESGAPRLWREVGPLDYRLVNGQDHLKFVAASDGRIRYLTSDGNPTELFQRVHGLKQFSLFTILTTISAVVFIITMLIWIIGAWARYRFRKPMALTPVHWWLRLASRIGTLLQLAAGTGWLILIAVLAQQQLNGLTGGIVPTLIVLYILGVLGVLGGIAIIIESLWRIARGPGFLLCRGGEALLGLCALHGIWAILAYGLASFNTHF
ncbi:MAG: serine hydrolase domain-containing protein [Gammaproteobacteria bacterium]